MDKAITDTTGVGGKSNKLPENEGKDLLSPNTTPSEKNKGGATDAIASKKKKDASLIDPVAFWAKLQNSQVKSPAEKDAEKQRKDALDESKKQTGLLAKIMNKPASPGFYA